MSWDATFVDVAGTPANSFWTYIAFAGQRPLVQDLALVALRTELLGLPGGPIEVPGLVMVAERTGPLTYVSLAVRDNLGGAATPMPGGAAMLINAPTGSFRGLAFNVFPFAIPPGTNFTIASGFDDPVLDLNGDQNVSLADLHTWLSIAGSYNLPSGNPYLNVDANLDGHVDGLDFIVSLDFHPDGTLFALDNGTHSLIEIDIATGTATTVGLFPDAIDRQAMAFAVPEIDSPPKITLIVTLLLICTRRITC